MAAAASRAPPAPPSPLDDADPRSPPSAQTWLSLSVGELCCLLPEQPAVTVESSKSIAAVCSTLQSRSLRSCVVQFPSGERGFFQLEELCTKLLDALGTDSCPVRVLSVLATSHVGEVVRQGKFAAVPKATRLDAVLKRLAGEQCGGRVPVVDEAGEVVRVISSLDLLELLLRYGRATCAGFREPAEVLCGRASLATCGEGSPLRGSLRPGQAHETCCTASGGDSALACLERLRASRLPGLAVLDDADPRQSLLERAVGTIHPSDVGHFFLARPEDAAHLAGCSVQEFLSQELRQFSGTRASMGVEEYPFLHSDLEHDVGSLVSKLVASHASCIALCSLHTGEVHRMVCASDVLQELEARGLLQSIVLEQGYPGVPPSPRSPSWPAPEREVPPLQLDEPSLEVVPRSGSRVRWVDEEHGAKLAEVLEFTPEPTEKEPPAPLALQDVPAGSPALDGVMSLPATTFTVRQPATSPASGSRSAAVEADAEEGALSLSPRSRHVELALANPGICSSGWMQLGLGALTDAPLADACAAGDDHVQRSHAGAHSDLHSHVSEHLQLVLYQRRELVLYDRQRNRAFARQLTDEQASAITRSRLSFCPLCRQVLSPSWAFVVEGYFDMISHIATPSAAEAEEAPPAPAPGGFSSNEEAAAACSLHSIPVGVLNCGYYSRFFVEERKLGSGSFGAVYLCRHVMDGIDLGVFAVKKLALGDDTKRLRQVIREVKALERLRHLNIVDYKHSWLEVSRHSEFCPYVPFLFILMEFCNAGSMESLVWPAGFVRGAINNADKAAFLSEDLIWRLFLDVCCGLAHLHSRGILHRDLKPSNIMLHIEEAIGEHHATRDSGCPSRGPRAMLSDFGTCEIHGEGRSTDRGGYAVEFVAPERLRGEESEEPADVWSAGLVLYALCAGDLPYHSEDPDACREQVMAHTVLSKLPTFRDPCLCGLISALTAREPVARPTAEEAERACAAALCRMSKDGHASGAVPIPASPPHGTAKGKAPLELKDEALLELMDGQVSSPKEVVSAFPSGNSASSGTGRDEF